MNCSKCNHELSAGAVFCGNCGQPVPAQPQQAPTQESTTQVPAQVVPVSSVGSGKATASLILGILGLVGAIIPILGLVMGIVGIVLGSMSLKSSKRGMATAGIILGVLVVLFSLVIFCLNIYMGLMEGEDFSMFTVTPVGDGRVFLDAFEIFLK